jgi:toxin ParE1/3/4
MKRLVLVRPEAEQDLASARDWYEQKSASLSDEFLDSVAIALRELEHNPELSRAYYRKFRRMLLRRFPYKIFYHLSRAAREAGSSTRTQVMRRPWLGGVSRPSQRRLTSAM